MRGIEAFADAINNYLGFVLLGRVTLYRIAWSATFACVLIAWIFAKRDAIKSHPRHYAAMALLACTWMLVLATYIAPGDIQTTRERQAVSLASDIAAILLVYIGGLIAAGAQQAHEGRPVGIDITQQVAHGLLLFVALPPAINFALYGQFGELVTEVTGITKVTSRQMAEIIGLILVIAGFYSLWRAASHICEKGSRLPFAIAIILILYVVPQVLRMIHLLPEAPQPQPSEVSTPKYPTNLQIFVLWNAVAKLLLTFTLSIAVYKDAKAYKDVRAAPAAKAAPTAVAPPPPPV